MSLINYVEPVSIGEIFIGIGGLILCIVLAVIFYRLYIKLCQYIDVSVNKEIKYSILEEDCLQKIASKRNLNLDDELMKRNIISKPTKNFRKKIEEQVFNDMFPESEKK